MVRKEKKKERKNPDKTLQTYLAKKEKHVVILIKKMNFR